MPWWSRPTTLGLHHACAISRARRGGRKAVHHGTPTFHEFRDGTKHLLAGAVEFLAVHAQPHPPGHQGHAVDGHHAIHDDLHVFISAWRARPRNGRALFIVAAALLALRQHSGPRAIHAPEQKHHRVLREQMRELREAICEEHGLHGAKLVLQRDDRHLLPRAAPVLHDDRADALHQARQHDALILIAGAGRFAGGRGEDAGPLLPARQRVAGNVEAE